MINNPINNFKYDLKSIEKFKENQTNIDSMTLKLNKDLPLSKKSGKFIITNSNRNLIYSRNKSLNNSLKINFSNFEFDYVCKNNNNNFNQNLEKIIQIPFLKRL